MKTKEVNKILYLAGPISKDKEAEIKFYEAQHQLNEAGFLVINPLEINPGIIFVEYDKMNKAERVLSQLKADISVMVKCDGVATLPLCVPSSGMARELNLAYSLRMPVMPLEWWLNKK
ncbi:MAG: DUF4406 domain-containing protein [Sphaerochaetaceae bacterium]|nr:DUF4406 domain-containing protein [Sphaerochaetaceae bacterium]